VASTQRAMCLLTAGLPWRPTRYPTHPLPHPPPCFHVFLCASCVMNLLLHVDSLPTLTSLLYVVTTSTKSFWPAALPGTTLGCSRQWHMLTILFIALNTLCASGSIKARLVTSRWHCSLLTYLLDMQGLKEKSLVNETLDKVDALKPIAEELGASLAQLALAWCAKTPTSALLSWEPPRSTRYDTVTCLLLVFVAQFSFLPVVL